MLRKQSKRLLCRKIDLRDLESIHWNPLTLMGGCFYPTWHPGRNPGRFIPVEEVGEMLAHTDVAFPLLAVCASISLPTRERTLEWVSVNCGHYDSSSTKRS